MKNRNAVSRMKRVGIGHIAEKLKPVEPLFVRARRFERVMGFPLYIH